MIDKARTELLKRSHETQGSLNYLLEVFGHELADKQGWEDITGMGAIWLYLINKHHWLPRDVRSMTPDDLRLALHQEMQGWTVPPGLR